MACTTLQVVGLALLLRLLLIPLDLYRSTDFEVHRNWLAITHSLPLSRWYYEDTSPWTLDYPLVFACFEWALSQAAALADPQMLRVANLEYASTATVVFQRASVALGDLLLATGARRAAGGPEAWLAVALVLLNPALLLVDHIHFQYNGMLLGLLLHSVADIEGGRTYRGAVLFCVLLNAKQIFLYVAPVYFVYLLRAHCGLVLWEQGPRLQLRVARLVCLGAVVVASFAAAWAPLACTGQILQAVSRLFPFGRGLTHAYWAPNVWALYNTADRALAKLGLGGQRGQSSTAGMAEVYESSVLWTVPPKATFALTALAYLPLLAAVWRQTRPPAPSSGGGAEPSAPQRRGAFALYVALGSAVAFSLGWHVHEKAILMVTIPLLVAAARSGSRELAAATAALSAVATFSVLPLLPHRPKETCLKWLLLVLGHAAELQLLRRACRRAPGRPEGYLAMLRLGPLPGPLLVLGVALLAVYCDFGGHELIFKGRMEFLPLLLISDFSAVLVLGSFARLYSLAAGAGAAPQPAGKDD
mmetsp:Transcript_48015/g.153214  ORF Transcript_48015/g.153214 Transcript_48015/m.153214 type:complete len:530 (-) Transcript_48015:117-1706(-)